MGQAWMLSYCNRRRRLQPVMGFFTLYLFVLLTNLPKCHTFLLRPPPLVFLNSNYQPTNSVGEFRQASTTILQAVSEMTIQRGCQFYCIHYDLVKARRQQVECNADHEKVNSLDPPIVVLHGGPGIPSDYLRPLETIVKPTREFLFWDQLGCGKSDRPDDELVYSIDLFVDDLVQLLDEVSLGTSSSKSYHLYGQSFGGILAFEFLKRERPQNCLSVVLSSTPTNVPQVEEEVNRLIQTIQNEEEDLLDSNLAEAFRIKHQCRTPLRPKPLEEAYAGAGTVFRGTASIADYVAKLGDDTEDTPIEIPALVLRGEHDFVTSSCIQGWKDLFQSVTMMELESSAHHGLLERPDDYGKTLESFRQTQEQSALAEPDRS